jgi:hypothetical protein
MIVQGLDKKRIRNGLLGAALLFVVVLLICVQLLTVPFAAFLAVLAGLVGFPLSQRGLDLLRGKEKTSLKTNPLNVSLERIRASQGKGFHTSQWVSMRKSCVAFPNKPNYTNTLQALFGVIKVEGEHGNVTRCRAEARYGTEIWEHDVQTKQNKKTFHWMNGGNLSWFSESVRSNSVSEPDFDMRNLGGYLANSREDLYQDNPRYLLVCYIQYDQQVLWICSDLNSRPIGSFNPGETLHFKIEITFAGEGLSKPSVRTFDGEASLNSITMRDSLA